MREKNEKKGEKKKQPRKAVDLSDSVSQLWVTGRIPLHIRACSPSMDLSYKLVLSEALIATDIHTCGPIMTIGQTSHAGPLAHCCHLSQGQIGIHEMIHITVAGSSGSKYCDAESASPVLLPRLWMPYFTADCINSWVKLHYTYLL